MGKRREGNSPHEQVHERASCRNEPVRPARQPLSVAVEMHGRRDDRLASHEQTRTAVAETLVEAVGQGINHQPTKGIADYRAGRYEPAGDWLRKSLLGLTPDWFPANAVAGFFLAMAYHRLGRTDEARPALAQAHKLLKQEFGRLDHNSVIDGAYERVIGQIVGREADALVSGKAAEIKT
jgi:Flp pilus assembly protein TadD